MAQVQIIPAIDLLDGNIVRLYKGDYSKKTIYTQDILLLFSQYVDQGAEVLHLVDLSGAKNPQARQLNLVDKIIKKIPAKIQIGGGIRTEEDIRKLLDIGANKIVIGSVAVEYPLQVINWFKIFGVEKFVLALDVNVNQNNQKKIAIHGWQEQSSKTLEQVIEYFLEYGLKNVLCTDIARDGTGKGANIDLYFEICNKYPTIDFQSSGGINSLNDIYLLKNTNIKAIVIGKALLDGNFTLKEAVKC